MISGFIPIAHVHAEERITHFGPEMIKTETKSADDTFDKETFAKLIHSLTNEKKDTRIDVLWKLRMQGDTSIVPDLIPLLEDKRPYVRVTTCELLAEIGNKTCLPKVTQLLLTDKNEKVKEAAAKVLFNIGDRSVVPALIKALNQPRPLAEGIGYWLFPNDIYDNYRYDVVKALNRITGNTFFYRRNETNFNRIAAQKRINTWWKNNEQFYSKEMSRIDSLSAQLVSDAKTFKNNITTSNYARILGGNDLARHSETFYECAKDLHEVIAKLPENREKLKPLLAKTTSLVNYIDEIFIYSQDLKNYEELWNKQKDLLKAIRSFFGTTNRLPAAPSKKSKS